jgi:hypothetical protein
MDCRIMGFEAIHPADSRVLSMKKILAAIILPIIFIPAGCASANGTPVPATSETPEMTESTATHISGSGTVRFLTIEGGFWGIVGDDGENYDPLALDPAFQKEGLRVRFEAVPETDMMSTRMWGTLITLVRIEAVNDG